ncbi:MAG: ParA family protein, partial [Synergistaceae bacterium]|nr:ParA family protein [Synergistaceae bacterium]
MKVVSVINFKGGVGKTTLTANLGAYAASQGYKVLLVDLDYQKTLTCTFMTNEDWKKKFSKTKTMKIFFEPVLNGQLPSLKPLLVRRAVANEKLDLLCSHDDLRIIEPKLTGLLSNVDVPSLAADYMKFVSCLRRALNNIDNL